MIVDSGKDLVSPGSVVEISMRVKGATTVSFLHLGPEATAWFLIEDVRIGPNSLIAKPSRESSVIELTRTKLRSQDALTVQVKNVSRRPLRFRGRVD